METTKKEICKDATLQIGLLLIVLSLGIFLLPDIFHFGKESESFFGIFVLNYLISCVYFIIVWIRKIPEFKISHFLDNIEYGFIHLLLCLISAYSLNREIPVFEQSTPWVQVFLSIQGIILLLVFVKHRFAKWFQIVFWCAVGIIFSFFLYLSIYLIPLYAIGFAAFFVLGISLHALIPACFVAIILIYLSQPVNRNKWNFINFCIGILISITIVFGFLGRWNNLNQIITKASDKSLLEEKNDLPEWAVIAQRLPKNTLSEKMLKTGLVYSQAKTDNWQFFNMPSHSFDEVKKHDPFVIIATCLYGAPKLSSEQQIKILESMYDSRHKAQERLWSGDDLQTTHVLTNVRLFPNLRIGYTEKFITIRNNNPKKAWRNDQEAIYTFHLPEGSVVTSLSLWINGIEDKAVLTSKHKADSAYNTTVGIQRHDPSIVRWQEGNTVSVRVFPCTPGEDRRFKIGITSPLLKLNNKLAYNNIWFDGPSSFRTDETIKIHSMDNIDKVSLPAKFIEESINTWQYNGPYQADWSLQFPSIPIKQNTYCFDGKSYSITNYQKTYVDFNPADIYLDINSEWTRDEYNMVRKSAVSKKIFVFQNQRIQINDQNAEKLFDQLSKLNFSVFPIYEIPDPEHSLIITKGNLSSPNVSDLGESDFASKLKKFATSHKPVKLYCLNNYLSPYLKTLKELRVFEFEEGSPEDLTKLLTERKFVSNQENSNSIIINDASIKITETSDTNGISNAPDHLMRLFAYNHVMYKTGTNYFDKDFLDTAIVDEAYKAYVVSPVSSLIVLETAQDYKRFNIKDDGVSLKNASMKSSGSVPEPHEWLLIIVIVGVVMYLYFKKKNHSIIENAA